MTPRSFLRGEMRTHTHTFFWSEDQLTSLLDEAKKLRTDYEGRIENNSYLPSELKTAAKDRIDNLDIAIRLMGDKAD